MRYSTVSGYEYRARTCRCSSSLSVRPRAQVDRSRPAPRASISCRPWRVWPAWMRQPPSGPPRRSLTGSATSDWSERLSPRGRRCSRRSRRRLWDYTPVVLHWRLLTRPYFGGFALSVHRSRGCSWDCSSVVLHWSFVTWPYFGLIARSVHRCRWGHGSTLTERF